MEEAGTLRRELNTFSRRLALNGARFDTFDYWRMALSLKVCPSAEHDNVDVTTLRSVGAGHANFKKTLLPTNPSNPR
jgi:hypothetical protein